VSGALLAAQPYEESHFNPFARSAAGGRHMRENLQVLCEPCNQRKADRWAA
jgi:5-methylcytosine-specific restriction endonuclease McrA